MIEKAVLDGELVLVRARASVEQVACHACGTVSGRVHSRYARRLTDTAVAGCPVVIELQVRRFRCRERACTQIPRPRACAQRSRRTRRGQAVGELGKTRSKAAWWHSR
ncbi:transposase family protein [Streptomyces cellulosae]